MRIKEYALTKAKSTSIGSRLVEDKRYRVIATAVISLILHLLFAFYNGILGVASASVIFVASSVYYLLLSSMRFIAIMLDRKSKMKNNRSISVVIGILLIVLSILFQIMVFVSMKFKTATSYGTIPMITIATFTFSKITLAVITAVKHKGNPTHLFRSINAIRYSEVAVSLLTMQQSMLVSFEGADETGALILNACTGAGVCLFIFALGIITLKQSRKENAVWQNQKS